MTIVLLITGIALLLAGGTALVRGASGLAEIYGVSPLVVGLTVVAFGTSAPELMVNVLGALRNETALAFGNIAGSNIANLGLVLGMAALFMPLSIQGQIIRRELPLLLLATSVLVVMTADPFFRGLAPVLDRSDGMIMLLLFSIFLYLTASDLLREKEDPLVAAVDALPLKVSGSKASYGVIILLGAAGLALGANLTIEHGSALATAWGVSPVIVGIFVVAIGTSMPELVTSIIAAMNRQADLCVGNVIGSNIFNGMFVLPISALIRPLEVPPGGLIDLSVGLLLAAALIPIFIVGNSHMTRIAGIAFVLIYAGYLALRLQMPGA